MSSVFGSRKGSWTGRVETHDGLCDVDIVGLCVLVGDGVAGDLVAD